MCVSLFDPESARLITSAGNSSQFPHLGLLAYARVRGALAGSGVAEGTVQVSQRVRFAVSVQNSSADGSVESCF